MRTRGGVSGSHRTRDREAFSSRSLEAIFGTVCFSKMVPNGLPDGLKNVTKSDKKRHLKRIPQNMCKKRVFEWKSCQKSLKPEVPTSLKHIKKWCQNEANIHEKSMPELNKKRCLKTEIKKTKEI